MSLEPARLPLILFCLALSGCGGDFGPAAWSDAPLQMIPLKKND
jgi:hypothetical protein